MSSISAIRRTVEDYRTSELITGALKDISATKMQHIRGDFELNARFFAGIREVYGIVKAHAEDRVDAPAGTPGAPPKKHARARDIHIALTSNKRFYGNLIRDIIKSFVNVASKARGSDLLVVGLTGAKHLEDSGFAGTVSRLAFGDDTPNAHEMQGLLLLIASYARVFVIYPKFVNTFRQDVVMTDVTETPEAIRAPGARVEYIFEPEIPRMLEFFEAQVRRTLFERVMLETELARAAARALRMRDAQDNAVTLRKHSERVLHRELAAAADLELMETFSGFSFWKQQ